jgi:hypothetical protein
LAAVILDVLAGSRTPPQAAEALALSLPRYYQLETRALAGLIAACEPRPRGRRVEAAAELARANAEVERLKRELSRTQALVRLTQRTVGVSAPTPEKPGTRKRKRKPVVRALRRANELRPEVPEPGGGCATSGVS